MHKPGNQLLLLSCLFRMLYVFFTGAVEVGDSPNRDLERMKRCMEYIRDHYQEPVTLADGAALLAVTPEHFCRLFRKYTGQTFYGYVSQVRMTCFYRDIMQTDETVTEPCWSGMASPDIRAFCINSGNVTAHLRRNCAKSANCPLTQAGEMV